MLQTLDARGEGKKSVFFMPGGCGPCRFGMYNCLQRMVLEQVGRSDVTVLSPNQDNNFYREFARSLKGVSSTVLLKDFWKAAVGIDLLHKSLLRVRPYATNTAAVETLYQEILAEWSKQIEKRRSVKELTVFMEKAAQQLADVPSNRAQNRPRIGVVGEIYVRSHPFTNNDLIRRLEALGAVCELSSFSEWVYYVNVTNMFNARLRGEWGGRLGTWVQNTVQIAIEKRLAEPLEKRFGRLTEGPIAHVIDLARPYIDPAFEGEAVLSVGKMVEMYQHGVGGVVNVMPFSCMPSTVVGTQTPRLSAECGGMPILNLSFDGQEDAALTTRLEAFVEQVRQHGSESKSRKVEDRV